jgi:outer membrane receptor protein involved in Fe transport
MRPTPSGVLRWLPIVVVALLFSTAPLFAQANVTGVVKGYVTDSFGNFVPGASVSLSSPALVSGQRDLLTDAEGFFLFNGIPVGTYSLRADVLGYPPYEIVEIQINPADNRVFDIELQEGLSETVTVVAERHLVDTVDTSLSEVVDADYVNRLPLFARRYQQILTLFPGVSNDQGFSLAQYHIDGSRVSQNGFRLDGATINDQVTGTFGLNVNQNAIERFELNTSGFMPEYGEQSGGIANIITKSGTNEFEFFYSGFYRDDAFASNIKDVNSVLAAGDADGDSSNNNKALPETQQWQEFAVGGPIIQDKLWFFSSFQYWQEDVGSIFNDSVSEGDRYHGQFKLTYQVSPVNTLVMNFATDPAKFTNVITDARYDNGTNYDQTQGGWFAQFRDTHIFSPNVMLESQLFVHHQYLTARPSEDNLGDFTLTYSYDSPTRYSGTWFNDQDRSTDRIRLSEALTVQKGEHTFKAGLDYSYLDFTGTNRAENLLLDFSPMLQDDFNDPNAQFVFTYDYLTPERTDRTDSEAALFVQDTWLINEHLTLNGGVRVDYQSIIEDVNVAPRLGVAVDPGGKGISKIYANVGRYYDNVFTDFVDFQEADGTIGTYTYVVPSAGYYYYDVPFANWDYVTDGDIEAPYKDSWTLGYEREFPGSLRIGVSTTHWEGKNQLRTFLVEDLSTLPSGVDINPNATAAVLFDSKGEADYDDYKIYFRKALRNRFELMGSYTHSRVRGEAADDFGFEDRSDPEATKYTRLSYDRPDVFNLSGTVFLPAQFELTGIYRYQSGRLYSPLTTANGFLQIDPSEGKNSRRMPSQQSLDLSAARLFRLGRTDLKTYFQVFNVFNHLNVVDVETLQEAGPGFGEAVQVDQGRTLQVGLEVRF